MLLLLLGGCSERSVGPDLPPLELVVAGGDTQYGTAGTQLPEPLRVIVRNAATRLPVEDVSVRWAVDRGDATLVGPDVRVSDEVGAAEIVLRLGGTLGEVIVKATVADQPTTEATVRAYLVGAPSVQSVEPAAAAAGATVVLRGENFSPVPDQNAVFFSGIRGRVTAATTTRLEVSVPACLPERPALGVWAALGAVSSDSVAFAVTSGGPVASLDPGDLLDLDDPEGLGCVRLAGDAGAEYLAVAHSAATVAGASHPFQVAGLVAGGGVTAPLRSADRASDGGRATADPQAALDTRLREEESGLIGGRSGQGRPGGPSGAAAGPARVPAAGERREFYVYNGAEDPDERFDVVTATARVVGQRAVVYVDDDAPAPGFTDADLQAIAARFDQVIHPTVTGAFGSASDLDRNQRIAILFTPVVNTLTERGSTSFVGGFFYGRDLLPELSSSNAGEVFYALVPDPDAIHGDRRDREQVLGVVPAILAHEFMHMVHFNQRVILLDGTQDALWMQEGLAQMAEELVARAYEERAAPLEAQLFREGNRRRARIYLAGTDTVSLIVSSGSGSLAERGAGFLFLLYLGQQEGADVLGRLARTRRTGVTNVEAETGASWSRLVPDWMSALQLDRGDGVTGPLTYPGLDLPAFLGAPPPLLPEVVGSSDLRVSGVLPSSGGRFFILRPPLDGTLSVAFGGGGGASWGEAASLGLRIVRVR